MLVRECLCRLLVNVMQAQRIVVTDRNLSPKSLGGDFGACGISRAEVVSFKCGFHGVWCGWCGVWGVVCFSDKVNQRFQQAIFWGFLSKGKL